MSIYVKFAEEKKPKTINEFLIKFYTNRNIIMGQASADITYSDKKCFITQCDRTRRSFDDLLELTKTYYTSITPKTLMSKLLKLKPHKNSIIYLTNCSGMMKTRISFYIYGYEVRSYENIIIESKYNSKYSWKELFDMLNIKNNEQLKKYIKN